MKGLLVWIYKHCGSSCDAGFFSSKYEDAILVGEGIPKIFETREGLLALVLEKKNGHLRAVPAVKGEGAGPMFGGSFIYSSDARFPSDAPIKIFDRWEPAKGGNV